MPRKAGRKTKKKAKTATTPTTSPPQQPPLQHQQHIPNNPGSKVGAHEDILKNIIAYAAPELKIKLHCISKYMATLVPSKPELIKQMASDISNERKNTYLKNTISYLLNNPAPTLRMLTHFANGTCGICNDRYKGGFHWDGIGCYGHKDCFESLMVSIKHIEKSKQFPMKNVIKHIPTYPMKGYSRYSKAQYSFDCVIAYETPLFHTSHTLEGAMRLYQDDTNQISDSTLQNIKELNHIMKIKDANKKKLIQQYQEERGKHMLKVDNGAIVIGTYASTVDIIGGGKKKKKANTAKSKKTATKTTKIEDNDNDDDDYIDLIDLIGKYTGNDSSDALPTYQVVTSTSSSSSSSSRISKESIVTSSPTTIQGKRSKRIPKYLQDYAG